MFLFKGWTPAFIRLGPNTVLLFVFYEVYIPPWHAVASSLIYVHYTATEKGLESLDGAFIDAQPTAG